MRILYACLMILVVIGILGTKGVSNGEDGREPGPSGVDDTTLEEAARKLGLSIRHRRVILLRFQQDTERDAIAAVVAAVKELPSKIDAIRTFEWGSIQGPQEGNQAFTHCLLISFDDAQARDALERHPAYQALQRQLRPHLDEWLVVDYQPEGLYWRPSQGVDAQHDIQ